ncbi:hypothetical protein GGH96_006087 [Coemansia sp. RSA 1972]|nr:hypothetical protein GGH96_006087 [Coemansia sp. RSA 1972]
MRVIERAEAQEQIAKKAAKFAVNVDDIQSAQNERVTSMVVPFLYINNDDHADQSAICITDEIQQLKPDNVQPAENKRTMSTIVPFSYPTDDYHVDQSAESVLEEMQQLRLYFEEQAHLFNVIVDISSPRDSAYSAESGCLPPSEYCFS